MIDRRWETDGDSILRHDTSSALELLLDRPAWPSLRRKGPERTWERALRVLNRLGLPVGIIAIASLWSPISKGAVALLPIGFPHDDPLSSSSAAFGWSGSFPVFSGAPGTGRRSPGRTVSRERSPLHPLFFGRAIAAGQFFFICSSEHRHTVLDALAAAVNPFTPLGSRRSLVQPEHAVESSRARGAVLAGPSSADRVEPGEDGAWLDGFRSLSAA